MGRRGTRGRGGGQVAFRDLYVACHADALRRVDAQLTVLELALAPPGLQQRLASAEQLSLVRPRRGAASAARSGAGGVVVLLASF